MISRVAFYLILPLLSFGCSSSGDFKAGGAIGVTRNDNDKDDDKDDENDTADEPVEVSGSFLTCSFMNTETQVVSTAKAQPDGSLDVACGLFRQVGDAFGPVDDSRLKLQTRILTNQGKLIPAEFRRLPLGTQMQHITTVPVKHLSGTIHVDYYDPETGNYSSRRKSIPSITAFSATFGYSVADDESVRRFVNKEMPLNGSIDPKDTEESEDSLPWWEIVVEVIKRVYGPAASVKASSDNGSTIYQPATHVNKPAERPDSQNTNFPINQPSKPTGSAKPDQQSNKPNDDKLDNTTAKPAVVDDPYVKVDMSKPEHKPETKPETKTDPAGETNPNTSTGESNTAEKLETGGIDPKTETKPETGNTTPN